MPGHNKIWGGTADLEAQREKRPHKGGMPKGHITKRVKQRMRAEQLAIARMSMKSETVLCELAHIAFADIRGLFDEAGNLKPVSQWTPQEGAMVQSVEIVKRNLTSGDGQIDLVHRVKLWDKTKALETLAKHFGLLRETLQANGQITFSWAQAPPPPPVVIEGTITSTALTAPDLASPVESPDGRAES